MYGYYDDHILQASAPLTATAAGAPAPPTVALEDALASLTRDLSKLSARLKAVDHTVKTECKALTLRLHYPAFRQRRPMVSELVDAVSTYIVNFCLPRQQVADLNDQYGKVSAAEFTEMFEGLRQEAFDLFKRAHVATNRNGEAGELILYLLTEWLLDAPQIVAKMSLKTNTEMPVHGADGVHVRYCGTTGRLYLYWGESKLYGNLDQAITEAAKSIAESLDDKKIKHEIMLVKRHLDLSGLPLDAKKAMLDFLDPFGSGYANRHDVISCLIVFDFAAFKATLACETDAEEEFCRLALAKLEEVAPKIALALKEKGIEHQEVEMFIIPVPSVATLRDLFQDKIGWKHPATKKAPKKQKGAGKKSMRRTKGTSIDAGTSRSDMGE